MVSTRTRSRGARAGGEVVTINDTSIRTNLSMLILALSAQAHQQATLGCAAEGGR